MRRCADAACVALALVLALPLHAQGDGLIPGARVRVWPACPATEAPEAKPCTPVVGQLVSMDTARVLIQRAQRSVEAFPLGSSARLEVSAGARHHTLLGLGAGAAVGFGAGMILASRAGCGNGIFDSGEREDDLCGAYGVAIPIGAVLGAVVGRLIRSERWRSIALEGAGLRLVPSRERLALSIRLAL